MDIVGKVRIQEHQHVWITQYGQTIEIKSHIYKTVVRPILTYLQKLEQKQPKQQKRNKGDNNDAENQKQNTEGSRKKGRY